MNRYTNGYEQFIKIEYENNKDLDDIAIDGYKRWGTEFLAFLRVWCLVYIDGMREMYKTTNQLHQTMNDIDAIYLHLVEYVKKQREFGNLKGRDEI